MTSTEAPDTCAQVEALAAKLSRRGFATTVVSGGQYVGVTVLNRDAAHMADNIYAAPDRDGSWWFWWSWADRIEPIGEVDAAAAKIAYVLSPNGNVAPER
jgi:hypothetical protein